MILNIRYMYYLFHFILKYALCKGKTFDRKPICIYCLQHVKLHGQKYASVILKFYCLLICVSKIRHGRFLAIVQYTFTCIIQYMVFIATFNNISVISWWSVLFEEETRVPGENHRPVAVCNVLSQSKIYGQQLYFLLIFFFFFFFFFFACYYFYF